MYALINADLEQFLGTEHFSTFPSRNFGIGILSEKQTAISSPRIPSCRLFLMELYVMMFYYTFINIFL